MHEKVISANMGQKMQLSTRFYGKPLVQNDKTIRPIQLPKNEKIRTNDPRKNQTEQSVVQTGLTFLTKVTNKLRSASLFSEENSLDIPAQ